MRMNRNCMGDIGMAAFSVIFMQSPSFLVHQWRLQRGHWLVELRELVRDCRNSQQQLYSQ